MGSIGKLLMPGQHLPGNYLPEACKGCTVVHKSHPLIFGVGRAYTDEPPFQWDPGSKVFAVVNGSRYPCFTYLTFCVDVLDRNGSPFEPGETRSDTGEVQRVTTFVVVAEPGTIVRIGRIEASLAAADLFALELERLMEPPLPPVMGPPGTQPQGSPEALSFGFPLPESTGPYLCTQGVGGHLTHFFPESYHAIDLRCNCHTPVLSIGDGVVKDVLESHSCGGVHVENLAFWNAVTVRLDCGLIVEYLHTLPGTARVKAGDVVHKGQVLCESGDIGFAPEPHLHIELHEEGNAEGPSVPLLFSSPRSPFVPCAGRWYSPSGEVPWAAPVQIKDECAGGCLTGGCLTIKRKLSKAPGLAPPRAALRTMERPGLAADASCASSAQRGGGPAVAPPPAPWSEAHVPATAGEGAAAMGAADAALGPAALRLGEDLSCAEED